MWSFNLNVREDFESTLNSPGVSKSDFEIEDLEEINDPKEIENNNDIRNLELEEINLMLDSSVIS